MLGRYAIILVFALFFLRAQGQESLRDLVSEAKTEWMVGKWEATGDNGETITLDIQWDLDKHVMLMHVTTPNMESKGYTFVEPGTREAKYVSFDNRGSVGKGAWSMESDELVLRTESRGSDRGPLKAAF